jgi:hypothetical protein
MRRFAIALVGVALLGMFAATPAGAQPPDPCDRFIARLPLALPLDCAPVIPASLFPRATDPLLRGGPPRISTYDPAAFVAAPSGVPGLGGEPAPPNSAGVPGSGSALPSGTSPTTAAGGSTLPPSTRVTTTNTGYPVRCADGAISTAGGRPGACSQHGGVAR